MDSQRFKSILIRDKLFLQELYQSSNIAKSKEILHFASDLKLKTLITFLHLISSGQIPIRKENFEKLGKRHIKVFRSHFDKKASYRRLSNSSREEQLKVLYKLLPMFPFLLYPLFNEN